MMEGTLLDRLTGFVFLFIGIGAMWHAQSLDVAFSADPVGPKVFPTIVGAITAVAGAAVIVRPQSSRWEGGRWARVILVSVASLIYPELLIPLGFVLATSLLLIVIARVLEGRWIQSVIASVVTSASIFLLIDAILGLPLPRGPWGF